MPEVRAGGEVSDELMRDPLMGSLASIHPHLARVRGTMAGQSGIAGSVTNE